MKDEKTTTPVDSEISTAEDQTQSSNVENDSQTETADDDGKIEEILGPHLSANSEEESSDEDDLEDEEDAKNPEAEENPEENGEEVSEKKDDIEKQEENEDDSAGDDMANAMSHNTQDQPRTSRLDRRLANLYIQNQSLQGNDNLPETEAILNALNQMDYDEKQQALKKLLKSNRALRSGGEDDQSSDPNDDFLELSEEDHEALIEAEAERRMQEMQGEVAKREWNEDLVQTVEAHPELNEETKEYDSTVAEAVANFIGKGMKASEAYKVVMDSIKKVHEEARKSTEKRKQKALSGVVSASNDAIETTGGFTWEELAKIQESDPERFLKLVQEGKLPEG